MILKKKIVKHILVNVFVIIFFLGVNVSQDIAAQTIFAENGIVASAHPKASEIGLEILRQGGNVVDAAIATAFALSVVEPYASGLGGGGFLVIKMKDQDAVTIDYRETAPGSAADSIYYRENSKFKKLTTIGVKAVGVPGVLMGLNLALEKFGTMKLKNVLQGAINCAEKGFPVNKTLYKIILEEYEVVEGNKELSNIYLNDGLPFDEGYIVKNQDYANTLKIIAEIGTDYFYKGELAEKIAGVTSNCVSVSDLAGYKALIKEPVTAKYKQFEIISSAPPSGGGTHLIELMNILENIDLKKLGHNSADYIDIFAKAVRLIQTDKSKYMADPDYFDVPVNKLIDKEYAKASSEFIKTQNPDFIWRGLKYQNSEPGSTTSLVVVDNEGNMVSITQSINLFFGSGITVEGTGIILNNHLGNFDDTCCNPNSIAPGKRPVSSIAPTLILKNGKPLLAIGTPGGSRIIGSLAQILVNLFEFNMTLDEAIDAPRFHFNEKALSVEDRIKSEVILELENRGYSIIKYPSYDKYFGGAQAAMYDFENHRIIGTADIRREGSVKGY